MRTSRCRVAVLFGLLLLLLPATACDESLESLPEMAWGTWTTRHDRYPGNYLTLSAKSVVFGQTGGTEHRANIQRVEVDYHRKGMIYRMDCFAPLEGAEYQFSVIVSDKEGGRLYLENRPQATWWRR